MVMKKIAASVMAAATLTLALAGCGKKDDKKFVVGFDQEFPPMGFVADDGSYVGFDLDLAKETAKRVCSSAYCLGFQRSGTCNRQYRLHLERLYDD